MKVVVSHVGIARMERVTQALAEEHMLDVCVHPLLVRGSWFDRLIGNLPLVGPALSRRLRRVQLLIDLGTGRKQRAGLLPELVRAALTQAPPLLNRLMYPLQRRAMYRRNRLLGKAAAATISGADIVYAMRGTALEPFIKATSTGTVRILDFPLSHHRSTRNLLQEEARLHPAFASTLDSVSVPRAVEWQFDEECSLADYILVGSDFARDSFIQQGIPAEKIVAINYGVDVDDFFPPEKPPSADVFRVLFVGQIGQRKGISYLFEGYRKFAMGKRDTELLLVGHYRGVPEVFEPYRHLFRHVPAVPSWEMPGLYRGASVLVLPSIAEGLGLVVLEAMASGLPVIVTPNGPGDVVTDGVEGFVIPIRDSGAIAGRLEQLHGDPALRHLMGEAAARRAGSMSRTWYNAEVLKFFQSTVRARTTVTAPSEDEA